MASLRIPASLLLALFGLLLSFPFPTGGAASGTARDKNAQQASQDTPLREYSLGQKLILKDGTYQVVREYQRSGDRVRYFSLERGEWEELPAELVDWDATAREAAAQEKAAAAQLAKIHRQEEGRRMDNVMDVDASLPVGDGVFLPPGEGLFVVEGRSVRLLQQAGTKTKQDALRTIEQVLSPVPIVPGKKNVLLPGARATLRLRSMTPEFYLREAPPDPEHNSAVERSSRPGESGPDLELLKAKVVHGGRELESIGSLFGQPISVKHTSIAIQRWEVAPTVYRFTLGEGLPPGEYAFTEILPDGLNLYVWDFGVDP